MQLTGKRALVTGGAIRIGKAIALELASQGCHIVLHYGRSGLEAKRTAAQVKALGVDCRLAQADLGSAAAAQRLGRLALRAGCSILVNNAAIFPHQPFAKTAVRDFDATWAVNLRAPALLTQIMGTAWMKAKTEGRIINIADVPSNLARPGTLPYSLSKAGLLQLTRAAAVALAPHVLVNSVLPGPMLMPPRHTATQKRASLKRSLLKRLGGAEEIARAVAFLASSDYMTGSDLKVDGGRELAG